MTRIVYMGDSITFGQYLDPSARWTALVDRQLRERFSGRMFETYNRGISGETTRMALERFPRDVQELEPHIMTLQFGLNDCNCWQTDRGLPRVSEGAYRANLIEMIARARRFGAQRIVLSTNHRTLRLAQLGSGEEFEAANARYCAIAREVALETGVDMCDIRQAFEPFDNKRLADLLLPAPDVLHLSEAGNRVYFDAIWPHIERAVDETTTEESVH